MNKKLIAIAIAGAMAPMAAQADVSISGLVQQELVSVSADAPVGGNDGLGLVDGMEGAAFGAGNASGLFFNASEDLGGGMKAIAKVGMNFIPDGTVTVNGDTRGIGDRDQFAGIAGGFGTVVAGTMTGPYKGSTIGWDPFVTTFMQARGSGAVSTFNNGYLSNTVKYSNTFGAIKFAAALMVDDGADDNTGTAFSVSLPAGPVEAVVALIDSGAKNDTGTKVGVKWNSGAITVAGQYELLGDAVEPINGVEDNTGGSQMYVTGSYAMGNNTVSAGFGSHAADEGDDTTYIALGVKHAMSKKVGVHAGYRSSSDIADVVGAGIRVKF